MGVTHYKTSIVTQYTMSHRPSITPACLEDIHSQVINNRYPINDSVLIENYLVIYVGTFENVILMYSNSCSKSHWLAPNKSHMVHW